MEKMASPKNRLAQMSLVALQVSLLINAFPAHADTLILKSVGEPRALHGPIFGASTTAFYEHLLDDPVKISVLKTMAIGLDRFSGGSDANFYNWRTGHEDFMFQLNKQEAESSRFQFGILKHGQNIKYLPFVFTEQGVAMLSSVLNLKMLFRLISK